MTLDNDHNPVAPHRPSDSPPRPAGQGGGAAQTEAEGVAAPARSPVEAPSKSADASDSTSSAAVSRAILAALPSAVRAAVILATLAWCRTLATVAAMVERRELGAVEARALADAATVTLIERPESPPHDVVCAILGTWWAAGPYDLARQVSAGTTFAGDFADAVEFLAGLEPRAPVTFGTPRVVRCAMPAGVDRVEAPRAGVTFLPAELSRATLDALTRDAARELGAVDPNDDRGAEVGGLVRDAQRAALDVHAAEGPGCPASTLAGLGAALAALAARESLEVEGTDDATRYGDRCASVSALAGLAARAYDAARAVCGDAVARGMMRASETWWPST